MRRVRVVVVGAALIGAVVAIFQNWETESPRPDSNVAVQTAKVGSQLPQPEPKPLPTPVPQPPSLPAPKYDLPAIHTPHVAPPHAEIVLPPVSPMIPAVHATGPIVPTPDPTPPPSLALSVPEIPLPEVPGVGLPLVPPKVAPPELDPIPPVPPMTRPGPSEVKLPILPGEGAIPPLPDLGQPAVKRDPLTPVPVAPEVTPPPAPKFSPFANLPDGAAAAFANQSRVRVKYEVTKAGPSGVGTVELWLKDKSGWSRAAGVKSGDPLEAELPLDGAYGMKVVPVSGQGVRGPEPVADGAPDLWIVRDTVAPAVSLKVTPAPAKDGKPPAAPFVVEVAVRDANIDFPKLGFGWSDPTAKVPEVGSLFTGEDLTKAKIETKIGTFERRKTGPDEPGVFAAVFDWTPSADVPARVVLAVGAVDRAGNRNAGRADLGTDLIQPAAKVVGVQIVPAK